jgi:hypothetical protein
MFGGGNGVEIEQRVRPIHERIYIDTHVLRRRSPDHGQAEPAVHRDPRQGPSQGARGQQLHSVCRRFFTVYAAVADP